ncbi:MAG: hypothetical protein RR528_07480, partial [Angelakisella sp.]
RVAGTLGQIKNAEATEAIEITDATGIRAAFVKGRIRLNPAIAVVGYVPLKDNVYIAVVKNVLFKRLAITAAAIILLGAGIYSAVNWNTWFPKKLDIDPNVVNMVNDNTPTRDTIQAPGFSYIDVEEATGKLLRDFENPAGNPCFFQIVIELDDNGKRIYESRLIPPNSKLEQPTLDKKLKAGTYAATLHYRTFSIEDQQPMNMVDVKTELRVQ